MAVRVTENVFDPGAELAAFNASHGEGGHGAAGALASFTGYCRAATAGRPVGTLYIEQYPGFTAREIQRLADDVGRQLGTLDLLVVHRCGAIKPGEAIVLVAALAAHRTEAFDAVRLLMDYLKTDAPLWKKESGPDGERWIEPTAHDHARRAQAGEKV
jgi:molybdopterin synthase catalytic subunit